MPSREIQSSVEGYVDDGGGCFSHKRGRGFCIGQDQPQAGGEVCDSVAPLGLIVLKPYSVLQALKSPARTIKAFPLARIDALRSPRE